MDHCVYLHKAAIIFYLCESLSCITVILRCLQDLFPPCFKYSTTVGLKVVQWACCPVQFYSCIECHPCVFKTIVIFPFSGFHAFKPSLAIESFWGIFFWFLDYSSRKHHLLKAAFRFFFYPLMIYFHFVFNRYECIVN